MSQQEADGRNAGDRDQRNSQPHGHGQEIISRNDFIFEKNLLDNSFGWCKHTAKPHKNCH